MSNITNSISAGGLASSTLLSNWRRQVPFRSMGHHVYGTWSKFIGNISIATNNTAVVSPVMTNKNV